ncbi:MAG: hypothetical protein J0I20_32840 [Chloroflexi bacterium]|nr:hypothetical protein [Chloroflexota bacterium]OJV91776.1 MAG: hypothetical protein BGO39_17965 [Chloroflexi bacterium 54-19]
MKKLLLAARLCLLTLVFSLGVGMGVGTALAHGGPEVSVKPLAPKAGSEITVNGSDLGANSTIEVRLIGTNVNVALGEVVGDDDGAFTVKYTLPTDLRPGTYQIEAKGAESATTQITVGATSVAVQPTPTPAPQPATTAAQNPVPTSAINMAKAEATQVVPTAPAVTISSEGPNPAPTVVAQPNPAPAEANQTQPKPTVQTAELTSMTLTNEARERPFGETLILVAVFGIIASGGILFARTARKVSNP